MEADPDEFPMNFADRTRTKCREFSSTATVKSIDPDAFMDQAASDFVLAVRV
jgi:hypothetical protein